MSGIRRRSVRANQEIDEIRRALGVVPTAEPAVFWIQVGPDRLWRARREGETSERGFASRSAALAHVEMAAARCRSYRIFVRDRGGAIVEEYAG
jgi:hypothetical protein